MILVIYGLRIDLPLPLYAWDEDAYAMRGHWSQSVTIIPSLDLVVVRMADDRKKAFSLNTFLAKVIPLVEGAP